MMIFNAIACGISLNFLTKSKNSFEFVFWFVLFILNLAGVIVRVI